MPTLSHAIHAALRETERGLAAQREQGEAALSPERIQLTLSFSLDAAGTTDASPGGPHSVTIELKTSDRPHGAITSPAPPSVSAALPATKAAGDILSTLSQVFGTPGFDSSARATVFREVLEGMSRKQALAVLNAVTATPSTNMDDTLRMASHLLRGVIQSGPNKALDQGVATLRELLTRHSLAEVLRVVEANWKSQAAWL